MEDFQESAAQLYVLLKKNWILSIRAWKMTAMQLLAPIAFLLMLLILQVVPHDAPYTESDPETRGIGVIPKCIAFDEDRCFSLMYAPNNLTLIDPLVEHMAKEAGLHIAKDLDSAESGDIVPMPSLSDIADFMWDNQNVTQAVVIFYPNMTIPNSLSDTFGYNVMFNGSCLTPFVPLGTRCPNIRYEVQSAVDRALLANLTGSADLHVSKKSFPVVSFNSALNDTVKTYGVLFFYAGLMFNFVLLVYQLAQEKEKKLKQGMRLMGLKGKVFWISWFLTSMALVSITTILLQLGGYACTFPFFWDTNFFVLFFTFFLFGVAMITFGFFVSTFVTTTKQAVSLVMAIFMVGVFLQMLLTNPEFIAFVYFDLTASKWIRYIIIWYPPFNFAKCISDITARSYDYGTYKGPGYGWDDLFNQYVNSAGIAPPATIESWYLLMMNTVAFAVLTWYFDNLIPDDGGAWQMPWFFLSVEYWGLHTEEVDEAMGLPLIRFDEDPSLIDQDVLEEDRESHQGIGAVNITRLCKQYTSLMDIIMCRDGMRAVDNVSLCIPDGTLMCLLGHNGAGKTTTINILTGLFSPSSGHAHIYGKSVKTQMDEIRRFTGVCPQHDILWNELTAMEHLDLFARLKNIPSSEREQVKLDTLECVTLTSVAHNRVETFSGGMKRRLSVAISSIGDPRIIFLDEPTTGMDPMSKRHVWDLIQELKKNRVIILTTHSMEEADVLSDRIGVMAHGKLRCIGNSLHLKSKFGEGYRLNVLCAEEAHGDLIARVHETVRGSALIAQSGRSLVFSVPTAEVRSLVALFQYLEDEEKRDHSPITDWGVSQTTLEDVFLKVTREVYDGGRKL